jgi:hypothetical protein
MSIANISASRQPPPAAAAQPPKRPIHRDTDAKPSAASTQSRAPDKAGVVNRLV